MKLFSLLLVVIGASLLPLPVHAVVLELRSQQTMATGNLTLNDLLLSSQGVTDDDLAAVIAPAPSLGKSDTWTRDKIAAILPTTLKAGPVEWTGATTCVVTRPAVQYDVAAVKRLITDELARHLPADADFAILEMPDVESFPVPSGPLETDVQLSPNSLRSEWGEATLKFRSEGQLAVTSNVRFHWAYTRKVWQASDKIAGGDQLDVSSFQQVEVNVLKIPGLLEPVTDFPEGKVAARALPQGKNLMANDWVDPVLVVRNDLVTILYEHHGLSITVQARAMANGTRNQVISVQNISSHKIFNARVVDERSLVYDE